eukprot:TRINITY_DN277_c0_g1_i2.p1 TRINITY_DN277_c0_g1~~TRINITY_DN277_c0_g1_i2.p1  ORF type:complete len:201 (+),score=35.16 TRINITY_DN277_c0_g1_i2:111-713(+)
MEGQITCGCKTDCSTKKCGCRKWDKKCGLYCQCRAVMCHNRGGLTPINQSALAPTNQLNMIRDESLHLTQNVYNVTIQQQSPPEDLMKVGTSFSDFYFDKFINDRHTLEDLFSESSCLQLGQQTITGKDIVQHLVQMGKMEVMISQKQVIPISSERVDISVNGIMKDSSGLTVNFNKAFMLVKSGKSWMVSNMRFRWQEN